MRVAFAPSAVAAAPSAVARAPLRRHAATNPLRRLAVPAARPLASRRSQTRVQAALLPGLIPIVGRAVGAFVLFTASMNWVFYRGVRKDYERQQKEGKKGAPSEQERRQRVNKLTGGKAEEKGRK